MGHALGREMGGSAWRCSLSGLQWQRQELLLRAARCGSRCQGRDAALNVREASFPSSRFLSHPSIPLLATFVDEKLPGSSVRLSS